MMQELSAGLSKIWFFRDPFLTSWFLVCVTERAVVPQSAQSFLIVLRTDANHTTVYKMPHDLAFASLRKRISYHAPFCSPDLAILVFGHVNTVHADLFFSLDTVLPSSSCPWLPLLIRVLS